MFYKFSLWTMLISFISKVLSHPIFAFLSFVLSPCFFIFSFISIKTQFKFMVKYALYIQSQIFTCENGTSNLNESSLLDNFLMRTIICLFRYVTLIFPKQYFYVVYLFVCSLCVSFRLKKVLWPKQKIKKNIALLARR